MTRATRGGDQWSSRQVRWLVVLGAMVMISGTSACDSRAVAGGNGSAVPTSTVPTTVQSGTAESGPTDPIGAGSGALGRGYVPPTSRPVVDRFRPPSTPYGPGNRGWEYATVIGDPVVSVGDGVVRFAGRVGGRGVVTVMHPNAILSSLTNLERIDVHAGQRVSAGEPLGSAMAGLHLGFRRDGVYLDPALFLEGVRHAVLVPVPMPVP